MNEIYELTSNVFEEWRDTLMLHKFALEEISTKVNILNEEFRYIEEYNPIEHIKTRIKKPKSIIAKLIRNGYEPTVQNAMEHVRDIAGLRIICSFKKDVMTVASLILEQDDIEVVKISDYISNPKDNGYQSYHMIVKVPVFLSGKKEKVNVEIQIRTSAMDFWASLEHKINYKYNYQAPKDLADRLKQCAEIASELDERMYKIKEDIETVKSNPNY